jgi:hypothetical protein
VKTGFFSAHFLAVAVFQDNRSLPSLAIQDEHLSLFTDSSEGTHGENVRTTPVICPSLAANAKIVH